METIIKHIIFEYEKSHPYLIAFFLSVTFISVILFSTTSVDIMDNYSTPDKIEFINIDTLRVAKRVVRKSISAEKGEINEKAQVDRASGASDVPSYDLAFYPNITPPKPIGRLKKIYPKSAREQGVEATLYLEIEIDTGGLVRRIHIIRISLSKDLPPKAGVKLMEDFKRDAYRILKSTRWTPSIVSGRKVHVKYLFPLKFRLE
jgi:hypothetical protein